MNELKKKVSKLVKEFTDKIFDEADTAETEQKFINKGIIGKGLNDLYNGMDMAFIDFSERNSSKKKKGW